MADDVDAVIVTYQSGAHLRRAIAAARNWDRIGRIIVVDNGSTDDSVRIAREVADEVVESGANLGFGAGQNLGVAKCASALVLLLNPDAVIHPDGLEAGWRHLVDAPDVAMVQGVIRRAADGQPERSQGAEPGLADLAVRRWGLRRLLGERGLQAFARFAGRADFADRVPSEARDVAFLAAVAPLARRAAFDAVGGFDADISSTRRTPTSATGYAPRAGASGRCRSSGRSTLAPRAVPIVRYGGRSSGGAHTTPSSSRTGVAFGARSRFDWCQRSSGDPGIGCRDRAERVVRTARADGAGHRCAAGSHV